jgi:hypothetical protein
MRLEIEIGDRVIEDIITWDSQCTMHKHGTRQGTVVEKYAASRSHNQGADIVWQLGIQWDGEEAVSRGHLRQVTRKYADAPPTPVVRTHSSTETP